VSCFVPYIAAAGGGGPTYPPGGTTSELIPSTGTRSTFGTSIAVAADPAASTIAVGDASANCTWVFTDLDYDGAWTEQQRITEGTYSNSGTRLAINRDGNTLAISMDDGTDSVVRVLTRSGSTYSVQQTITRPSNISSGTWIVRGLTMDDAGDRLAIGAPDAVDSSTFTQGSVHIYKRTAGVWALEADKTNTVEDLDYSGSFLGSGWTLSMSAAGDRLAIVYRYIGYVEVLVRSGTTWTSEYFVNWDGCATAMLARDTAATLVVLGNSLNGGPAVLNHYATRSGSTWTAAGTISTSAVAGSTDYTLTFQHGAALAGDAAKMVIGYGPGGSSYPAAAGRVLTFNASFVEGTAVNNPGRVVSPPAFWGGAIGMDSDAVHFAACAQTELAGRAWVRYL
jgi:hypothetical protein